MNVWAFWATKNKTEYFNLKVRNSIVKTLFSSTKLLTFCATNVALLVFSRLSTKYFVGLISSVSYNVMKFSCTREFLEENVSKIRGWRKNCMWGVVTVRKFEDNAEVSGENTVRK